MHCAKALNGANVSVGQNEANVQPHNLMFSVLLFCFRVVFWILHNSHCWLCEVLLLFFDVL